MYGDASGTATADGRYPLATVQLPDSILPSTFSVTVQSVPATIRGVTVTATNTDGAVPGTTALVGQTGGYSACASVVASGPTTAQPTVAMWPWRPTDPSIPTARAPGRRTSAEHRSDQDRSRSPDSGLARRRHGGHPRRRGVLARGGRWWSLLHGDAVFYGSEGAGHLNQPIVGMAATPDGGGTGSWPPTVEFLPSAMRVTTAPWAAGG